MFKDVFKLGYIICDLVVHVGPVTMLALFACADSLFLYACFLVLFFIFFLVFCFWG